MEMRFISTILFILINSYLIESLNQTEISGNEFIKFEIEESETVPHKDNPRQNGVESSENLQHARENNFDSTSEGTLQSNNQDRHMQLENFLNEIFLPLGNLTADKQTSVFKAFSHKNDVHDLHASGTDNLYASTNQTFQEADPRISHEPPIAKIEDHLTRSPFKHSRIDTADFSDCALQGEWKPISTAQDLSHHHYEVDGAGGTGVGQINADILQSGSYALPQKTNHLWQDGVRINNGHPFMSQHYRQPPFPVGKNVYGTSGYVPTGGTHGHEAHLPHGAFRNSLSQYHKNHFSNGEHLETSELSPPAPPFIIGKRPAIWKTPMTSKLKFYRDKRKRPGSGSGLSGFLSYSNPGEGHPNGFSQHTNHGGLPTESTFPPDHVKHGLFVTEENPRENEGSDGFRHHLNDVASTSGEHYLSSSYSNVDSVADVPSDDMYGSISSREPVVKHEAASGTEGVTKQGVPFVHVFHYENEAGATSDFLTGENDNVENNREEGGRLNGDNEISHIYHYDDDANSASFVSGANSGDDIAAVSVAATGMDHEGLVASTNFLQQQAQASVVGVAHPSQEFFVGSTVLKSNHRGASAALNTNTDTVTSEFGHQGITGNLISLPSAAGVIHAVETGYGNIFSADVSSSSLVDGGGKGAEGPTLLSQSSETNFVAPTFHELNSGKHVIPDSSFSLVQSSHSEGEDPLLNSALPNGQYNQDLILHDQGISGDTASTFTCGKSHDHNTKYHTASFQVADIDHPSSVDVIEYGGNAAVLVHSRNRPHHHHHHHHHHHRILSERKKYDSSERKLTASDNSRETPGKAIPLSGSVDLQTEQTEDDSTKTGDPNHFNLPKYIDIPLMPIANAHHSPDQYKTKPHAFVGDARPHGIDHLGITGVGARQNFDSALKIHQQMAHESKSKRPYQHEKELHHESKVQSFKRQRQYVATDHSLTRGNPSGKLPSGISLFHYSFLHKEPQAKYRLRQGYPNIQRKASMKYTRGKPFLLFKGHQKSID